MAVLQRWLNRLNAVYLLLRTLIYTKYEYIHLVKYAMPSDC